MRGLIVAVMLPAMTACAGGMQDPSTVEQQDGACVALEGRTFASINELECGRTPDGVGRCHWTITFATRDVTASDFAWSYSDVNENGRVECRGQAITATANGRTVKGSFDAASQNLVWGDVTYVNQP